LIGWSVAVQRQAKASKDHMQELKCQRCGADLETWNVENEGLYGRCTHCKTTYLIEDVERSHVVVDVRLPAGMAIPSQQPTSRRAALIGTGIFAAAAVTGLVALPRLLTSGGGGTSTHKKVTPLWNIGGRGPGPGQFRDYISAVTIDGQGRSAVAVSSSPVVQLFDGDGHFLARWVSESKSPRLLAALPGGDLIVDGSDNFERRDPMTGNLRMTTPKPDSSIRAGTEKSATTPDGGFAVYYSGDSSFSTAKKAIPDDRIVYFGPDGSMGRTIGPLIGKVFQPDPAVPEVPDISAMAIDGAGTIYLLFHKKQEFDTREGLYAFNPDGLFLRKIEIDQKFYGMLAATADGTLFHADPWMTRITRIKGSTSRSIDVVDLKADPSMDVGMPFEIAAFPNGDLGLATGSERYLRIRWPEAT
jgi:hypothetical protein